MTDPIHRDLEKHEALEVTIRRRFEKAQRLADQDIAERAQQVEIKEELGRLLWVEDLKTLTTKYFYQLEDNDG